MAGPDTVMCSFCDQPVSFREYPRHLRTVHPDFGAAQQKYDKDLRRAWGRIALLGFGVWAAGFVLLILAGIYFSPQGPWYQLWRVVWLTWIFSIFAWIIGPVFYAYRAAKAEQVTFGARPQYCRICDRAMPGNMLAAHAREIHPAVARLLRLGLDFYMGTALGLAGLLVVTYFLVTPMLPGDAWEAIVWGLLTGGLVAWAGLALTWARFVATPRLAKARAQWHTEHPGPVQPRSSGGFGFRP